MGTTRFITNSTAATAGIVAILGIVARRLGIPWLGDAVAFVFKVPGVEFNWDFLWLLLLVGSIVVLIGINFNAAKRWNDNRSRNNERDWNMNVCDAVDYIAGSSHHAATFPERSRGQAAQNTFYEAARKGTLRLSGSPFGSTLPVEIPKHYFNGTNILDLKRCNSSSDQGRSSFLMEPDGKTILFYALFANRKDVELVWPPKPSSHGWMIR